jgi:hypothetical protein
VAGNAESLKVLSVICPAFTPWYDVVNMELGALKVSVTAESRTVSVLVLADVESHFCFEKTHSTEFADTCSVDVLLSCIILL